MKILDANPSAEETYGYSLGELINCSFLELGEFNRQDVHSALAELPDMLQSCVVSHKVQHYKKGRKPFYVRVTACPTRYMEKEAIILATTDITEMIEKDAQLIQASKMKTLGEMSAGIAHELNQPLNAIKIGNEYLQLLIETGQGCLSKKSCKWPGKSANRWTGHPTSSTGCASSAINRISSPKD